MCLGRRSHEADVRRLDLAAGVRAAGEVDAERLRRDNALVQPRDDLLRIRLRLDDSERAELTARAGDHGAEHVAGIHREARPVQARLREQRLECECYAP